MVYMDGGASYGWKCQLLTVCFGASAIAGVLLLIPAAVCGSNMKSIEQTIEDEIYDETISYLKSDTGANQTLAEYEGTAAYKASARYKRLEAQYQTNLAIRSACLAGSALLTGIGAAGGGALYAYVNRYTLFADYYANSTAAAAASV
jgi:hypothetical protein